MNEHSSVVLERLLRANNLGSVIDKYGSAQGRLLHSLLVMLDKVAHANSTEPMSFAPEALEKEHVRNPHKIRTFLQAMRMTKSAEMLAMVWRVLQGSSIREVRMTYEKRKRFELLVVLSDAANEEGASRTYSSNDVFDLRLLRHLSIATVAGQPSLNGFIPLDYGN